MTESGECQIDFGAAECHSEHEGTYDREMRGLDVSSLYVSSRYRVDLLCPVYMAHHRILEAVKVDYTCIWD